MSNVIQLRPNTSVPDALRNIAQAYEDGDYGDNDCTLVIGADVFHLGSRNDSEAGANAIFNLTLGIHKMMRPVVEAI